MHDTLIETDFDALMPSDAEMRFLEKPRPVSTVLVAVFPLVIVQVVPLRPTEHEANTLDLFT